MSSKGESNFGPTPWYKFLYCEIDPAAIFVLEGQEKMIDLIRPAALDSQAMYSLFESRKWTPRLG